MEYLSVTNAEYVDGLVLRIWFNDHTVRLVDFAGFLSKHPHPQYDKYAKASFINNIFIH